MNITISRSAFTREFLDIILHNSLTAMSFEDIGNLFRTNRTTSYLKNRTDYETHIKIYAASHKSSLINVDETNFPKFSAMDSKIGYNGTGKINDQFVIEVYCAFVHENLDDLEELQDELIIGNVCRTDATFNSQKRTTVYNQLTDGYEGIPDNSYTTVVNCFGQIIADTNSRESDGSYLITLIKQVLDRCVKTNQKFRTETNCYNR